MKDNTKQLRPWLESWGAWRRLTLNIGYPQQAMSCNPDLHIAKPIIEPAFRMPSYHKKLSGLDNAGHHLRRLKMAERELREFHHIKRTETKPKRQGIVPNYNPHWRMNVIDRYIQALPDRMRKVITLRFEKELKINEIGYIIARTPEAVNKRLANAYQRLDLIPRVMQTQHAPLKMEIRQPLKKPNCNNFIHRF